VTGRVLIVDDSLTVRMDLSDAFHAGGLDVIACATAGEARQTLEREPVDAIVLDVQLPDADGVEFLSELRTSPRHEAIPVLMLSSEADVTDRLRGLRTGADEYCGKPYDAGYVVARARQLLGSRQPSAPVATTVLLIDDSATLRNFVGTVLEEEGYAVVTAATGEDGLRIAGDRRPDVVIVDSNLPGIDGTTVIRRLRLDSALRDVPCLLLTGAIDIRLELDVLDAGADAFVAKDEDVSVLLAKVAAATRRSRPADRKPADREPADSLLGPKRILAVDADRGYLDALAERLRADGYNVVPARTGAEAVELLTAQPADCILLDLWLAGTDGPDTCRRIKATPALCDIPLIVLSAGDDTDAALAVLAEGADDYIRKSDQFDVLSARVRTQLRRRHLQDEHRRAHEDRLRQALAAAETRAAQELARTRAALIGELEWKNSELEAFNYSVSHDLRNPLNLIDGFSALLLEEHAEALDETGLNYLHRIRAAAAVMDDLIRALLRLSHAGRAEITRTSVDVTGLARESADAMRTREPDRAVDLTIAEGLRANADTDLLRVVLENLIGNAWKYTRRTGTPRIEVGSTGGAFFVRDNGAGFSMDHAETIFRPYGRLHDKTDFPGTGIGLATVFRIIGRHGGRIWADGHVGEGATFYFTTEPAEPAEPAEPTEPTEP
jgi:two-component system, NtrC family, sensor kinase